MSGVKESQICRHVKQTDSLCLFSLCISNPFPISISGLEFIPFLISASLRIEDGWEEDNKKKTLEPSLCLPFFISSHIYLHSNKKLNTHVCTRHTRTNTHYFLLFPALSFLICCYPWLRLQAFWWIVLPNELRAVRFTGQASCNRTRINPKFLSVMASLDTGEK